MRAGRLLPLSILVLLLGVSSAGATAQLEAFSFSGEIAGGDHPGYTVESTATFAWDDACNGTTSSFCTLTITLTADPSASGSIPSQGEVLTALAFDVLGGADFRDGPPGNAPWPGATVGASALIGSGAATASGELGTLGSGLVNVSGHWGLNPAVGLAGEGSLALSSVGDLFGGPLAGGATLGAGQLFSGPVSSVETNPPDGSRFGIVDSGSTVGGMGFPAGSLAYIQDSITAELLYTGTLSGLDNVEPLYGTQGLPVVPEPGTASLLGAGLLGLALARRRR